jgi:hypothetical protein
MDEPIRARAANDPKPTPGSHEARLLGCTCPVIDNHHGRGMPYSDGPRFWISGDCRLHNALELVRKADHG